MSSVSKGKIQRAVEEESEQQIIVANRYIIERKIGKGSFGEVYQGYDQQTKEPVAIKLELSKTFNTRTLLEGKILKKMNGFDGIPKCYFCGTEGDYNVLVLELLGPNLEDLLIHCNQKLTLKTVLMIADQLIARIEAIHNRGFIHRDIKSDNFLIGNGENMSKIYAIDFGLAKRYVHPHSGQHISIKKNKGLIGTARYASINAHLGLEQSRRDDLQSIGYLLVQLALGSLPWQKIKAKTKQHKYKKIFDMKDSYSPEELTKGLPQEFAAYLICVKRLEFEEKPDYNYLRGLFLNLFRKLGLQKDLIFDWMISQKKRDSIQKKIRKQIKENEDQKGILEELEGALIKGNQQLPETAENTKEEIEVNYRKNHSFQNEPVKQIQSLEEEKKSLVERILEKDYMQEEEENPLEPISEKNEDAVSRIMSELPLLELGLKNHSDVIPADSKGKVQDSPFKSYNGLKHPLLKMGNSFKSKGIMHLKELPQSDVNLDDLLGDVDEDVVNNVYQFNIHDSKLDKGRSPDSYFQKRVFFFFENMKTFPQHNAGEEEEKQRNETSQEVRLRGEKINQFKDRRQYGNSLDQGLRNNKLGKDSSMGTEFDHSSGYEAQLNKIRRRIVQNKAEAQRSGNTSSDLEQLIDKRQSPMKPQQKSSDDELIVEFKQFENNIRSIIRSDSQSRSLENSLGASKDDGYYFELRPSQKVTVKDLKFALIK